MQLDIRGGDKEQLRAVKKILLFSILAHYNLILENSYLVEEGATSRLLGNLAQPKIGLNQALSKSLISLQNLDAPSARTESPIQVSLPGEEAGPQSAPILTNNGEGDRPQVLQENPRAKEGSFTLQLLSSSPNIWYLPQHGVEDHPILKYWPTLCIPKDLLVPNFIDNAFTTSAMASRAQPNYQYPSIFAFKESEVPSPLNQQSIQYLHTLCCRETGKQCIPYAIHRIDFYSPQTDLSLLRFLQQHCFAGTKCQVSECSYPLMSHDRSFLHGKGRLNITLEKASEFLSSIDQEGIIHWSSCPQCQLTTPFTKMSASALNFSFGKWLEHSFFFEGNPQSGGCPHSITRGHIRYFMTGGIVAAVSFEPGTFFGVHHPPMRIEYQATSKQKIYLAQMEVIENTIQRIFDTIQAQIDEIEGTLKKEDDMCTLEDLRHSAKEERAVMLSRFETAKEAGLDDEYELNRFKKMLWIHAVTSNRSFQALQQKSKTSSVTRRGVLANAQKSQIDPVYVMYAVSQKRDTPLLSLSSKGMEAIEMPTLGVHREVDHFMQRYRTMQPGEQLASRDRESMFSTTRISTPGIKLPRERLLSVDSRSVREVKGGTSTAPSSISKSEVINTLAVPSLGESGSFGYSSGEESENTPLASPRYSSPAISIANPSGIPFSVCFHLPFGEEESAWDENWDPTLADEIEQPMLGKSPPRGTLSSKNGSSVLEALLPILPNLPPGVQAGSLSYAALQDASGLFLRDGIDNSVIVVSEKEPSSLIASALMSPDYFQFLTAKQREVMEQNSTPDLHPDYIPLLSEMPTNIDVTMGSSSNEGKLKFTVTVYHAVQFRALRNLCIDERVFIESISHSEIWDASGGKSGSSWEKTLDERFVIKRLPKIESESFISIASLYFKYLAKAYACQVPTLLAKIMGAYTINYRSGSRTIKQDVIVMENLFYNRKISKVSSFLLVLICI